MALGNPWAYRPCMKSCLIGAAAHTHMKYMVIVAFSVSLFSSSSVDPQIRALFRSSGLVIRTTRSRVQGYFLWASMLGNGVSRQLPPNTTKCLVSCEKIHVKQRDHSTFKWQETEENLQRLICTDSESQHRIVTSFLVQDAAYNGRKRHYAVFEQWKNASKIERTGYRRQESVEDGYKATYGCSVYLRRHFRSRTPLYRGWNRHSAILNGRKKNKYNFQTVHARWKMCFEH